MSTYVISEVAIVDESLVGRYQSLAAASIVQYGGRYLARGGVTEVVEGERPLGQRVIVAEFPSMERAHEWYASPEYAQALQVREQAVHVRGRSVKLDVPLDRKSATTTCLACLSSARWPAAPAPTDPSADKVRRQSSEGSRIPGILDPLKR